MSHLISEKIWCALCCSHCGKALERTEAGAQCLGCNIEYTYTEHGSIDIRLKRHRQYILDFDLGSDGPPDDGIIIAPLKMHAKPEVDFPSEGGPWHLPSEVLSYFPKARSSTSLVLDLGCGAGVHRRACEQAGFEWIGLDYDSSDAPILGDAHSLPLSTNSCEFILCAAVLEHIRYPFVMMREAHRVLMPGGKFIGTVAFLEPFHGDSYYHHSHLGVLNSLLYGGFRVEAIAPSEKWTVLAAQASMGLFPKMPGFMSHSLVLPIEVLHKLWWWAGKLVSPKADQNVRITNTTGAFTFIATKQNR